MHVLEWNKSIMYSNRSINQPINEKISYVGLPPKPDLFQHELVSQIPLFWNYEKKKIIAYIKSKETEDYLETKVELKLFKRKLNF